MAASEILTPASSLRPARLTALSSYIPLPLSPMDVSAGRTRRQPEADAAEPVREPEGVYIQGDERVAQARVGCGRQRQLDRDSDLFVVEADGTGSPEQREQ